MAAVRTCEVKATRSLSVNVNVKVKAKATGWTIGVLGFDSWRGAENFSLHHRIQNGTGAHTASYPMGNRGSYPGGKAARV